MYFKFQEKEASKGLIGEEWGGKFGGFGQDLNPRLKIWTENVQKNLLESAPWSRAMTWSKIFITLMKRMHKM